MIHLFDISISPRSTQEDYSRKFGMNTLDFPCGAQQTYPPGDQTDS